MGGLEVERIQPARILKSTAVETRSQLKDKLN